MKKWSWRGFFPGAPKCGDCVEIIRNVCPRLAFVLVRACPCKPSLCDPCAMPCANLLFCHAAQPLAQPSVKTREVSIGLAGIAGNPLFIGTFAQCRVYHLSGHFILILRHKQSHHTQHLMSGIHIHLAGLSGAENGIVIGLENVVKHGVSPFVRSF